MFLSDILHSLFSNSSLKFPLKYIKYSQKNIKIFKGKIILPIYLFPQKYFLNLEEKCQKKKNRNEISETDGIQNFK